MPSAHEPASGNSSWEAPTKRGVPSREAPKKSDVVEPVTGWSPTAWRVGTKGKKP